MAPLIHGTLAGTRVTPVPSGHCGKAAVSTERLGISAIVRTTVTGRATGGWIGFIGLRLRLVRRDKIAGEFCAQASREALNSLAPSSDRNPRYSKHK